MNKPKGLDRVLESIDAGALQAAAVGDKAAVKIYDAISDILTVSSAKSTKEKPRVGVRVDGRNCRRENE